MSASMRAVLHDWMEVKGWPTPTIYQRETPALNWASAMDHWSMTAWLLWALALEVDEHRATRTGERVCRSCGGREHVVRWSWKLLSFTSPAPWHTERQHAERAEMNDAYARAASMSCRCDGPTRPHTVLLHRLVETLASWRSPVVTDWPEQWAVNRDAMEAVDWGDMILPGDTEVTPAWVCQWWRALGEWTATGRVVDVEALAQALRERTEYRTRPADPRDVQARFILASPDAMDSERCIAGLWLGHTEVMLANASPWTTSIDMPVVHDGTHRRWHFPVTDRNAGIVDAPPLMVAALHRPSEAEREAIGRCLETHAELRAGRRLAASARLAASRRIGTRADIEASIMALIGVERVDVRELAPLEIEVHVWGGDRSHVDDALSRSVPAGIRARQVHH